MKPLLERKRRARINGCLDELKELMEYLGGGRGSRMQRLEKADVLEVTVNHLRHLKASGRLNANEPGLMSGDVSTVSTYRSGYSACASEVASFICNPYSGVQHPQAARIAMVVADGLTRLQTQEHCLSRPQNQTHEEDRNHCKDDDEESKVKDQRESNISPPSHLSQDHTKDIQATKPDSENYPLDLSVK